MSVAAVSILHQGAESERSEVSAHGRALPEAVEEERVAWRFEGA